MSPSPRPQTDDRIKIWLFRVSLFQDAYHICQNCLARPVQSSGEFHYWSGLSSPITLFLNGMHGSDRLKKKRIISFFNMTGLANQFWLMESVVTLKRVLFAKKTDGNARLLEIRKWNEYNPILSERSHWGTIPGNNKSVRISLASVLKSEKKHFIIAELPQPKKMW